MKCIDVKMFNVLRQSDSSNTSVTIDASGMKSAAWDEFNGILNLKAYWFSFVFIGVVISATGSFDTHFIEPVSKRMAFMVAFLLTSGLACAVIATIYRVITGLSSLKQFDVVAKVGFVWVAIATIPTRFMINYMGDVPITATQIVRSIVHGSSIALLVIVIMYFIAERKRAANRKRTSTKTTVVETERPKGPNLAPNVHVRLPYYIESEDHYLKMVYLGKVEFIRANLCEVAAGFAARGLRCHKSYWVSRSAIERRRRDGRQLLLVLKDGTEIPVGRSFEKEVRALLDARSNPQLA